MVARRSLSDFWWSGEGHSDIPQRNMKGAEKRSIDFVGKTLASLQKYVWYYDVMNEFSMFV